MSVFISSIFLILQKYSIFLRVLLELLPAKYLSIIFFSAGNFDLLENSEKRLLEYFNCKNCIIMSSLRSSTVKLSRMSEKFSISSRSTSMRLSNISSDSQDIAGVFNAISLRGNRQSAIIRPVLQYQPSYQLESKIPFNSIEVELLLEKIIENRAEELSEKNEMKSFAEQLSIEILTQVKMKNYDRTRIIVFVDVGEKYHQSFRYGLKCLWDVEKDSLARYIFERHNIFIIATVFGVYYD